MAETTWQLVLSSQLHLPQLICRQPGGTACDLAVSSGGSKKSFVFNAPQTKTLANHCEKRA
jgi:hypothetical protein